MSDKRFLSIDDLANLPQPKWLIEGLFEAGSLVMLAAPPASFKSFLLIDWLLNIAVGRKWMNRQTTHCKVAYVLGEGKSSLFKRIQAWTMYNQLDKREKELLGSNFRVTFDVPQLASKASVDNFLADLTKEDYKPDVVAIDTFARSFVGLDENDAKDTGMWIEQADRLRKLGLTVIFLHHTKKNTEFGVQYRGSSAIKGAMDTSFTMTRDNNTCTLKCDKQKDHDEGPDIRFRRLLVDAGGSEESCVLVPAPVFDSRYEAPEPSVPQPEAPQVNLLIAELVEDGTFDSDRARARELSKRTGMPETAAQMRIRRYVRQFETGETKG